MFKLLGQMFFVLFHEKILLLDVDKIFGNEWEIDTRDLPYNQIFNLTILAENSKTQSEPLVIEFLTSPPPIDNLTISTSHEKECLHWLTHLK